MAAACRNSLKWYFHSTASRFRNLSKIGFDSVRLIHHSKTFLKENNELVARPSMFNVPDEHKNKDTFLEAIKIYTTRPGPRRGQVEFIYSALKFMEEFGVQRDLQAYKDILDILPKGTYIPTNMFQAEFMHYPKQQQCILDLLEQMEDNGVMPDAETEDMVLNIFGNHGFPTKKLKRMAYWMPKFKNLSPWPLPDNIPNSNIELAKLAIQRMCSVDPASKMDIFHTKDLKDAIDDTWIVSGQSPTQRELLQKLGEKQTVYVEGAFTIWLRRASLNYFILRSDATPLSAEELERHSNFDYDDVGNLTSSLVFDEKSTELEVYRKPSVHEQADGTILAVAVTGTSSKDSLLSWIRFLERTNPHLANLSVLFATYSPLGEVIPIDGPPVPPEEPSKITDGSRL